MRNKTFISLRINLLVYALMRKIFPFKVLVVKSEALFEISSVFTEK